MLGGIERFIIEYLNQSSILHTPFVFFPATFHFNRGHFGAIFFFHWFLQFFCEVRVLI